MVPNFISLLLQPAVTTQPVYYNNNPAADMRPMRVGPPEGNWRDNICDCCRNLWPSCGCVFIFDGFWMLAQSKWIHIRFD